MHPQHPFLNPNRTKRTSVLYYTRSGRTVARPLHDLRANLMVWRTGSGPFWSSTTYYLLLSTQHFKLITHYSLLITHYSLLITHHAYCCTAAQKKDVAAAVYCCNGTKKVFCRRQTWQKLKQSSTTSLPVRNHPQQVTGGLRGRERAVHHRRFDAR